VIEAHVPVPGTPHELTVLVNTREARALAPDAVSLGAAVGQILGSSGAAAVVVKDSARGCLVLTAERTTVTRVDPYPTRSVWPLGSGDVFAAGYASAWANGADPVEAARVASGSAAWWCGTRVNQVPAEIPGRDSGESGAGGRRGRAGSS